MPSIWVAIKGSRSIGCHCGDGCFAIGVPLACFAQYSIDQRNAHTSAKSHCHVKLSFSLLETFVCTKHPTPSSALSRFYVSANVGESEPGGELSTKRLAVSFVMVGQCQETTLHSNSRLLPEP